MTFYPQITKVAAAMVMKKSCMAVLLVVLGKMDRADCSTFPAVWRGNVRAGAGSVRLAVRQFPETGMPHRQAPLDSAPHRATGKAFFRPSARIWQIPPLSPAPRLPSAPGDALHKNGQVLWTPTPPRRTLSVLRVLARVGSIFAPPGALCLPLIAFIVAHYSQQQGRCGWALSPWFPCPAKK